MDGLILSGARGSRSRRCSNGRRGRRRASRALGHRRERRRGAGAAQRLRVLRGRAWAPASLGAYAVPVNWHFKDDEAELHHPGLRRQGLASCTPTCCRRSATAFPAGVQRLRRADAARDPRCLRHRGRRPARCRPDAVAWDAWLASAAAVDRAAARHAHQHDLHLGHDGAAQRRAPRSRRRPRCRPRWTRWCRASSTSAPARACARSSPGRSITRRPTSTRCRPRATAAWSILQPRFEPEDLLRQIERHRITHLHMVPTMFVRLLKLPDEVRAEYDLSSLNSSCTPRRPARPTSSGR